MVFGRRKRSASAHHQPLSPPASQSAQSAASHAFLRSQPSTGSLSSAAAAAALRNSTPTPTSIGNVETKRMVQRRASTQSQVNPAGGRRSASVSGTLRRSSSNSSMTARTFREQSPHRPATSSGPIDVPPLPSLPTQYGPRKLPNSRAISMGPSMRSPPSSPPRAGRANREHGRGSPIHIDTHQRVTTLGTVPELERSASRISANFSYPNLSRPTSPTKESETEPLNMAGALQKAPIEEPERVSKREPRARASGSMEAPVTNQVRGPLAASAAAQALSPQKGSPQQRTRTEKTHDEPTEDELDQVADNTGQKATPISESEHQSSRTLPERWPSTVREETEHTEEPLDTHIREGRNRMASSSPTTDHLEAVPEKAGQPPSLRQSNSPGRARFSQLLSVADEGNQIHQPPPRSVSPFKSALKHPRGSSLSPERNLSTTNRAHAASELSDGGTSVASDEGSRFGSKKKPPKVSFDDEAEVVGVAASPPTSPEEYVPDSPPGGKAKTRMSFFGKKTSDSATHTDGFNAVIKPRQALPSFGSVRGNRKGTLQRSPIPDFSDNDSSSSSENEVAAQPVALSNDHAIAGMLHKTQDHGYFKPRNVSPLEQMSVNGDTLGTRLSADKDPNPIGIADQKPYSGVSSDLAVPAIAVEPATPPLEGPKRSLEQQRSSMDQYRIPGGFPPSNSDRNLKSTAKKTSAQAVVASAVPNLDDVDTEGESGDSVYSDAAEDIDGDGFGSINAIVDSRSAPRSVSAFDTASESRDATPKASDRTAIVDTQSHDVTDQAGEVRSVTPTQDSVSREVEESPISPMKARNLDSAYPLLPINTNFDAPKNGTSRTQINGKQRPLSVAVSPTSRVQDPRFSSNESSPRDGKSRQRPMSLGPAFQKSRPAPRRTLSSGSDSSSSFKRTSPRGDGAHAMRRTMRAGASPAERNESPIDYRPMSAGSSNGTGTMRKTLRGTGGAGNERYSFFSTNNKAPRSKVSKQPPRAAGSTRFADSDGEEDGARAHTFQSRFESSDEEHPGNKTMRPVRGIPRRQGADDGDSTELDDSSEEGARQQARPAAAQRSVITPPGSRGGNEPRSMSGMAAVAKQRGMSQRDLEQFLLSPPRGRKPGLLTRLGLKKDKNIENKIRKADVESPSRRDTHLERSRLERDQLREDHVASGAYGNTVTTVTAGSPEQPHHSKLVKRNSKRNTTDPSWPLHPDQADQETLPSVPEQTATAPSSVPQVEESKSQINAAPTSNGTVLVNGDSTRGASPIAKQPGPIRRESRTESYNDNASEISNPDDHGPSARDVVIAGSGRKKRFPMLRKAFGLKA